ncbi:MAG: chorismate mutase [Chlamydiales bacterium]
MLLNQLRSQMDAITADLVALLAKRTEIAREIALIKKREGFPIFDPDRENEIKSQVRERALMGGISPVMMEEIIQIILDYTRVEQGAV